MRRTAACLLTVSLFTIFAVGACNSSSKRVAAESAPAYQPTPQSTPVQMAVKPGPKLAEVQEAVKRVFKDAAVIDTKYNPQFLAGDFNGDSSQDIAVIVKPARLDQMNEQYPAWLLRDPLTEHSPRTPLKVEKDETLLAVIHGYGANDWRDPEATQTFVLKNVVGSDLRVHTGKEFATANSGRKLPRPQGDLIGETLHGTPGYLYYFASNYSWYDPKTFKGETPRPGMFHQPKVVRAHALAPQAPPIATVTAEELKAKLNNNEPVTIIDVRSAEAFAASTTTIKNSFHFKVRKLRYRLGFAPLKDLGKDSEIVTYCSCPKDESSIAAAKVLQDAGFRRVKVLQGGWNEWLRANGPVQSKPRG